MSDGKTLDHRPLSKFHRDQLEQNPHCPYTLSIYHNGTSGTRLLGKSMMVRRKRALIYNVSPRIAKLSLIICRRMKEDCIPQKSERDMFSEKGPLFRLVVWRKAVTRAIQESRGRLGKGDAEDHQATKETQASWV